jgi:hypothetical protein
MTAWTAFDQIATSLSVIAGCAVVTVLKQFGFWRWLGRTVLDWTAKVR